MMTRRTLPAGVLHSGVTARTRPHRIRSRAKSEKRIKAANARSSQNARLWMFVTSSCEVCEKHPASFVNEQHSYKRVQQSYESERECKGRVRHDIESNVVHSGTKLTVGNSCEARNGDEGTSSLHVNLERKECRSDAVRSEFNSRFEFLDVGSETTL